MPGGDPTTFDSPRAEGTIDEAPANPTEIWCHSDCRRAGRVFEARRFHSFSRSYIMGLNERRKIKELKETTFPGREKEIEEICGKSVPYEVDWDSLADSAEALNFLDNLACHRLNMALRMICVDDV